MLLGSCWGIYARVILVPIPVRLLVTHTYHKTAGLIRSSAVCMSFGPFDQLIVHMSAGRPAETGPRVIPRCLPFLTVCPVCLPVCVWEWAFLLISICLCCCLFQFFDLYMVHNVLVCTSSPRFPLLLSSPLVSAQILCEVQKPSMPAPVNTIFRCQSPIQIR